MVDTRTRAELATLGVRVAAPVRRRGGAGPTGDSHLVVDGIPSAIPVDDTSPYAVLDGRLVLDGRDLGVSATAVSRPAFYDEVTSDGVAMHRLARLHGADVLATTVVQTCVRYRPEERCRYCSIEESLASGATTRVKTPAQLAEVAATARRLDGVAQVVMTTGTAASADRGARHLARCVRAVKAAVPDLPVQVQCEPPDDPGALAALRAAGADSIGIHVESLDDACRRRWLPGKARVPLSRYWAAWTEAVQLWGRNQVSTYLLVGLGEDPDELVAGATRLADAGVYPFVVPVRPGTGTLAAADGMTAPDPAVVARITAEVAAHLDAIAMRGGDQAAGCAACGACSTLAGAEGRTAGGTTSAGGTPVAVPLGARR